MQSSSRNARKLIDAGHAYIYFFVQDIICLCKRITFMELNNIVKNVAAKMNYVKFLLFID